MNVKEFPTIRNINDVEPGRLLLAHSTNDGEMWLLSAKFPTEDTSVDFISLRDDVNGEIMPHRYAAEVFFGMTVADYTDLVELVPVHASVHNLDNGHIAGDILVTDAGNILLPHLSNRRWAYVDMATGDLGRRPDTTKAIAYSRWRIRLNSDPERASFRICLSKVKSETARRSRPFSFSSSLRRLA